MTQKVVAPVLFQLLKVSVLVSIITEGLQGPEFSSC